MCPRSRAPPQQADAIKEIRPPNRTDPGDCRHSPGESPNLTRRFDKCTIPPTLYPNVPPPVGAVTVDGWELPHVTGHPYATRYWVGSERTIHIEQHYHDDIKVMIDGVQHSDGRVEARAG